MITLPESSKKSLLRPWSFLLGILFGLIIQQQQSLLVSAAMMSSNNVKEKKKNNNNNNNDTHHQRQPRSSSSSSSKQKELLASSVPRSLIIGGETAVEGDYPYFAYYDPPGCGGSLIAPDVVLTAAHCLVDPDQLNTIQINLHDRNNNEGNNEEKEFMIRKYIIHPEYGNNCCAEYNDETWAGDYNDFMILVLLNDSIDNVDTTSTTTSSSQRHPNKVIQLNQNPSIPSSGTDLYVIGFGDINNNQSGTQRSDLLQEAIVTYLTNDECVTTSAYPSFFLPIQNMCAYNELQDSCGGDSGGPLFIKTNGEEDGDNDNNNDVQVGVVSWGWGCNDQPGVYARVSEGYDWIRHQVCQYSQDPPSSFHCEPPRITLPEGNTCRSVTTATTTLDPALCCSSIDDNGQDCLFFTDLSSTSSLSSSCETRSFVEEQDSDNIMFHSQSCQRLLLEDRELLPFGVSCTSITDPYQCCHSIDNRQDGGSSSSIYDGSPCVSASSSDDGSGGGTGRFSNGNICESAAWVIANDGPTAAMDCSAIPSPTLDDRVDLREGLSCQALFHPLTCCASRDSSSSSDATNARYRGQDCIPAKNDRGKFSSLRVCEPVGWAEEFDPESVDEEYCDELRTNQGKRELLAEGQHCATILNPKRCCGKIDNRNDGSIYHGQPCVPTILPKGYPTTEDDTSSSKNSFCEPVNWVAEKFPNFGLDCVDVLEVDEL